MKLSVILVNYNVKYFIEQCLYSVRAAVEIMDKNYGSGSTEVFVVDNNSVDGSVELIRDKFPEVTLIANKENTGFSKANNQAIKLSQGQYILLLNPDTIVEEDTFMKCCRFMDEHKDGGGLGVYMVDGKGRYLPESKRGLPTPEVAFYKIFGLSAFFKNSPKFGRYHLTYLDKNKVHEIDVLSGAFMFMRKETLDKTGWLDEDFFMYGEDIDLSYRIQKAGYKNYYFPETKIIHYKGESTKKGSANYVFIFYNAMIIFAKKHFASASWYITLIQMAIYLRATASLLKRMLIKCLLPLMDFVLLYAALIGIMIYWEQNHRYVEGGKYPPEVGLIYIPACVLLWQLSGYFSGLYKPMHGLSSLFKPVLIGTTVILLTYALLPEYMRFSRAIILVGAVASVFVFALTRSVLGYLTHGKIGFLKKQRKRTLIVAGKEEFDRISSVLKQTFFQGEVLGFVSVQSNEKGAIGNLDQLPELVRIFRANEVVFSGKELTAEQIIWQMSSLATPGLEFKTAPTESLFIIGSNSVNTQGELYMLGIESISKPENKTRKRRFDIICSLLILFFSPILVLFGNAWSGLLFNCYQVLRRQKTWVAYTPGWAYDQLPKLEKAVIHPLMGFDYSAWDPKMVENANLLYAKNYTPEEDLRLLLKHIGKLSNRAVIIKS